VTLHVGWRGSGHQARVGGVAEGDPSDVTPDPFAFTGVTAGTLSTIYESGPVAVSGLGAAADLSITGGEYSINSGAWSGTVTTAGSGDTVRVRGLSAGTVSTITTVTLTIGSVSASFGIETVVNAETSALALRFTADPGDARRSLIDACVGALKTAGAWAKLDVLYLFAGHDSQAALLNWKQNLYNGSAVNSPTFTTDRGYAGDGVSAYINSNFADNVAGANWSLDSVTEGVWINADGGGANAALGVTNTSNNAVITPLVSGVARARIHGTSNAQIAVPNRLGWTAGVRESSTSMTSYRGATGGAVNTVGSISLTAANICALRNNATYAADRVAAVVLGGSLTTTEHAALYEALGAYLTALGAT
jgi:hypothetical protein